MRYTLIPLIKKRALYLTRKICFTIFSRKVLMETLNILGTLKVMSWVDYGTLLGFVRSQDFIKNDFDIDIGVLNASREEIKRELKQNGFKLVDEIHSKQGHFTLGFIRKGVLVDIYGYISNLEGNVESIIKKDDEFVALENSLPGVELYKIHGKNIVMPVQKEEWLERIYGPNYVLPDPNYTGSLNVKGAINNAEVTHNFTSNAVLF
jgi:hypothetical protein